MLGRLRPSEILSADRGSQVATGVHQALDLGKRHGQHRWSWASHRYHDGGTALLPARSRHARGRSFTVSESEEWFRQLAETIKQVFWITTPDKNRMLYVSQAYEEIWGRTCESLYAMPWAWAEAIHPDDRERIVHAAQVKQLSGQYREEYRIVRPDGSVRWILDRAYPLRDASGTPTRLIGTAEDITERKLYEKNLADALHEKDLVLKELHHRVKGNLQVISSLLNLQCHRATEDSRLLDIIRVTQQRIRAMARLYDSLEFRSTRLMVNCMHYFRSLAADLYQVYDVPPERVRLIMAPSEHMLDMDRAAASALILNELLSNALTHAFPSDQSGLISVSLRKEACPSRHEKECYILTCCDNGVGFPMNVAPHNASSTGLQIVRMLVTQLRGTMIVSRGNGTTFQIIFPSLFGSDDDPNFLDIGGVA